MRPLSKASTHIDQIAKGDLTTQIEAEGNDEIGKIVENINKMSVHLRQMIASIMDSSATLHEASATLDHNAEGITNSTVGETDKIAASFYEDSFCLDEDNIIFAMGSNKY